MKSQNTTWSYWEPLLCQNRLSELFCVILISVRIVSCQNHFARIEMAPVHTIRTKKVITIVLWCQNNFRNVSSLKRRCQYNGFVYHDLFWHIMLDTKQLWQFFFVLTQNILTQKLSPILLSGSIIHLPTHVIESTRTNKYTKVVMYLLRL